MRITQLWFAFIVIFFAVVSLILRPVIAQEIRASGEPTAAETPILTPIVTAVPDTFIISTSVPGASQPPPVPAIVPVPLTMTPVDVLALPADDFTTWRAEYFNNLFLGGTPALVREEPTIDHVWYENSPAPGIIDTDFSARWTRNIQIFRSGNYRVVLNHDDGGRVWIDGNMVLDAWDAGQWVTHTADRYLTAGEHSFQVAIFDELGWAAARFSLQPLSFTGWRGEYFNNDSLSDWMAFVRDDNEVNFDWGYGSPAPNVVPSSYSARWTKDIQFDTAGLYRITVSHDDGVRVWIDNRLMLDRWTTCCVLDTLEVNFSQGAHNFRVEYNNIGGAGSIELRIDHIEQLCSSPLDLVLVLDGSGSIDVNAFAQVKQFSRNLVAAFNVSPGSAHIGVVQFASEGTGRIESALSDNAFNIISAIDSMSQLSGATDIQEGLNIGQSLITNAGRPQVQHVLVLLSDGEHNSGNQDPVTEAERIKATGTIIFAVAIGQTNIALMNAIASDPDSQHVFAVDDLSGLMTILHSLVTITCPPTPAPTATPTPARIDAAELASQSEYLTVSPGAAISPWIEVRNTGNTTWTPAQYGYNGRGALQGWTGYLARNVAPGGIYRFFWNLNAPTTPGVYDYGFMLRHGTQEFGPYFFVRVTVVPATWSLMYYLAGDNELSAGMAGAIANLENRVVQAHNPWVKVVVLYDGRANNDSAYYIISSLGTTRIAKGELNTGDPRTLADFITWVKANQSAAHYALTIAGHGTGISGVAPDNSSGNPITGADYLFLREMRDAISSKVDVIYMRACLMGLIEPAYELRDGTDYYVASQTYMLTAGMIPVPVELGLEIPSISNSTTPAGLARAYFDGYKQQYLSRLPGAISVLDMSKFTPLVSKVNALAQALTTNMATEKAILLSMQDAGRLQRFDMNGDRTQNAADEYVDLYDFAVQLRHATSQSSVASAALEVEGAVQQIVGGNTYAVSGAWPGYTPHNDHSRAHGISIFWPLQRRSFLQMSWSSWADGVSSWLPQSVHELAQDQQAVVAANAWMQLMIDFTNQTNPTDNPNPPSPVAVRVDYPHNVRLPWVLR